MIWSKYNYIFTSPTTSGKLLYNSYTNSFAEIDDDTFQELMCIKNSPQDYDLEGVSELRDQLLEAKIIVSDHDAMFRSLKLQTLTARFDPSYLSLTIAPTLDCNFNCEYCFEKSRPPIYMTDETENTLIEFIKHHSSAKYLSISWYGGEPLLAFDRICSITQKIKNLGIDYSSSIVTNGYLLDKTVIDELTDLRIEGIQITLDGPQGLHNRRRPHLEDGDSYSTIVKNLDMLMNAEGNEKRQVSIRMNVDASNQQEYGKLYHAMKNRYQNKHIHVYPGYVEADDSPGCSSLEGCSLDRDQVAKFMVSQYEQHNIKDLGFYPAKGIECMARNQNSYLVGPEGELYKCWEDIGNERLSIGTIHSKDHVNIDVLSKYLIGADPFDDEKCTSCFCLPICGGGCPKRRIKNEYEGGNIDLCSYFKGNLDTLLDIHYTIKKEQRQSAQEADSSQ